MQHVLSTTASPDADTDNEWHGELTIAHVRSLKDRVVEALASGQRTLDLTSVTHIDGAGLQLLLLLRREADRRGIAFDGVVPSRAVRVALDMAQVDEALRPITQAHFCASAEPAA